MVLLDKVDNTESITNAQISHTRVWRSVLYKFDWKWAWSELIKVYQCKQKAHFFGPNEWISKWTEIMRKICYAEMNLVKVPMVISQRNQLFASILFCAAEYQLYSWPIGEPQVLLGCVEMFHVMQGSVYCTLAEFTTGFAQELQKDLFLWFH